MRARLFALIANCARILALTDRNLRPFGYIGNLISDQNTLYITSHATVML
jgi:hypothetical protein